MGVRAKSTDGGRVGRSRGASAARLGLVFCAAALAFGSPVAIAADAGDNGGHWDHAREVAGALNTGIWGSFDSIACPSVGNCAAGGDYHRDAHDGRGQEAYVVNEVKGRWRKAEEVPGMATLNKDTSAETMSVSCSSAGNCAAGGYYSPNTKRPLQEPFVVNEVKGHWGKAEEVPGMSKMNGLVAEIESVSCSSAGNCSAGGLYGPSAQAPGFTQLFVVNEVRGHWGKAQEVPGIAKLNYGDAWLESLSCASTGNCSAGGSYEGRSRHQQAFVVNEVNGRWRKAEEVPGTAKHDHGYAWLYSLSCPSAGDCAATGQYTLSGAFVVNEVKGHWGTAKEVPGLAKINTGEGATTYSISCASPGNCAAGGNYTDGSLVQQAFVVNERKGVLGDAKPIPGLAALNTGPGGDGNVNAISCSSAGDCAAGGTYKDKEGHVQAFVANERNGTWGRAEEVPGTARLNVGGTAAGIDAISCSHGGACGAGGTYSTRPAPLDTFYIESFVVDYTPPHHR